MKETPLWNIYEITQMAPVRGNPFTEMPWQVRFFQDDRSITIAGFYDGDATFRARFLPDREGRWQYETSSPVPALHGRTGEFLCTSPEPNAHGPVRVAEKFHFAYADGTPFFPLPTVCCVWIYQPEAVQEQTLATLEAAPFNKLRMYICPKDFDFVREEPSFYPFATDANGDWDFTRFHLPFWQHLERRLTDLQRLGIEAELVLFHPFDRWGFMNMGAENDAHYLRYAAARLAAYRNVWWSLANEWDLIVSKTVFDWNRLFHVLAAEDPYAHLRSIHQQAEMFDHAKSFVTHCSVQSTHTDGIRAWRNEYEKPVIVDECCYEGNFPNDWGSLTARKMLDRIWLGVVSGGYVGHGETYLHPDDLCWWAKGGTLRGHSAEGIVFLRETLRLNDFRPLEPLNERWDHWAAHTGEDFYLYYFSEHQPAYDDFSLPSMHQYRIDILDVQEKTSQRLDGTFSGKIRITLPGKPYIAVCMRRVEAG